MTPPPRAPVPTESPDLLDLLATFGDQSQAPLFSPVAAHDMPSPYRELLAHDGHMTVTVESFFGAPAVLGVHATQLDEHRYARKITLHARPEGPALLSGIMRIHLNACTAPVRADVLAGELPLGRILIAHNVMRTLRSGPYYRVRADAEPLLGLRLAVPPVAYARIAAMHTPSGRAVELLEIMTSIDRESD